MVLIARALAAEPRILVLDEPESNLDFKNQLLVLQTLKQLSASNITCIFNTHYPAHALQYADQALMLGCDHTYLFGETKSVITEPNIRRYFGVNVSIHTIETPEGSIQNVTALSVADNSTETG
jgi:iron complex transport system ATP-binding protein